MDIQPFMDALEQADREHREPTRWVFNPEDRMRVGADAELHRKHYAIEFSHVGSVAGLNFTLLGLPVDESEGEAPPVLRTSKDGKRVALDGVGKPLRTSLFDVKGTDACEMFFSDPLEPIAVELPS